MSETVFWGQTLKVTEIVVCFLLFFLCLLLFFWLAWETPLFSHTVFNSYTVHFYVSQWTTAEFVPLSITYLNDHFYQVTLRNAVISARLSLTQKSTVSCPRGRCQGVAMTASPPVVPKWFPLLYSPHRILASRVPAVRITDLPQRHHGIRGKSTTLLGCEVDRDRPTALRSLGVMWLTYVTDLLSYAQNQWVIIGQ